MLYAFSAAAGDLKALVRAGLIAFMICGREGSGGRLGETTNSTKP